MYWLSPSPPSCKGSQVFYYRFSFVQKIVTQSLEIEFLVLGPNQPVFCLRSFITSAELLQSGANYLAKEPDASDGLFGILYIVKIANSCHYACEECDYKIDQ